MRTCPHRNGATSSQGRHGFSRLAELHVHAVQHATLPSPVVTRVLQRHGWAQHRDERCVGVPALPLKVLDAPHKLAPVGRDGEAGERQKVADNWCREHDLAASPSTCRHPPKPANVCPPAPPERVALRIPLVLDSTAPHGLRHAVRQAHILVLAGQDGGLSCPAVRRVAPWVLWRVEKGLLAEIRSLEGRC